MFELEFADMPLENAKSVRIAVEPGTYGQSQWAVFDIPTEVFFRGMLGHSQERPMGLRRGPSLANNCHAYDS